MIYAFITDEDLRSVVKDVFVKAALDGDLSLIKKAENIAIAMMRDKIKFRFDVSVIFEPIPQWLTATDFVAGDYCYDEGLFYKALLNNTNKKPRENTLEWTEEDPREAVVVARCSDITVYNIFKRINPRKIPDNIKEAYNEALRWLNEIRDYKEHPDLPIMDDDIDELPFDGPDELDHLY